MPEVLDQEYSPLYAPHVKGRYSRIAFEEEEQPDGRKVMVRQPQMVEIHCEKCGQRYRRECRQGQPRQHVARFASIHLHKHPLALIPGLSTTRGNSGGPTTR